MTSIAAQPHPPESRCECGEVEWVRGILYGAQWVRTCEKCKRTWTESVNTRRLRPSVWHPRRWTAAEDRLLKEAYLHSTHGYAEELASKLGRGVMSVRMRVHKLGLARFRQSP